MTFSLASYDWPAYQGRVPFKHQVTTVAHLLDCPRDHLLSEMGTGKTLAVLWAFDILLRAKKIDRVYLVAPLSILKAVWAREIFFNAPHLRYAICHGSRQQRVDIIRSQAQIVIINPDGVKTVHEEIERRKDKHLLVIDELTTYKNPDSDRTSMMIDLARGFKGVWGMTGELTPNEPAEAWSQVKVVNPHSELLPKYYGKFRDATMYRADIVEGLPLRPGQIPIWRPKTGAEHLVAAIAKPSIRFLLRECIDLPPTIYSDDTPEFSQEQTDAYAAMKELLYIETLSGEITAANAAVKLMKLTQIAAGAVKQDDGTVHFLECSKQLNSLKDIWQQTYNKKLIIVCAYQASFQLLKRFADKHNIKCSAIYGDVNLSQRDINVAQFQQSDTNWLLLQPQAAAHGLTLTSASHLYWFTLTPSGELYRQTNARIIRPSQTQTTHIIRKISCAAEKHIANILEAKGDMSASVMDLFKSKML